MTENEAVAAVLEEFPFDKVILAMQATGHQWRGPAGWFYPDLGQLRAVADQALRDAYHERGCTGTGGLTAARDGPLLALDYRIETVFEWKEQPDAPR